MQGVRGRYLLGQDRPEDQRHMHAVPSRYLCFIVRHFAFSGCLKQDVDFTGTWSDVVGADSLSDCQACGLGTYSTATGASSEATCNPCAKGKYGNTTGAGMELLCYKCPAVSLLPASFGKHTDLSGRQA